MKVADKSKNKKDKAKKKGGVNKPKPKKEQVLVVAQEIKYARWLSGNDKKTRDRVLKALKKWLMNCFEKGYEFKEDDFTRVWKGLFYAVWMSDKPLIQEELCESISQILDLFPPEHLKHALLMTKAGFKMLATEWYGIDHHRMDKFLMLVRRYLRGSLRVLKRCEWSPDSCQKYAKMLSGTDGLFAVNTPHYARNATSMLMHVMDCYIEELAKVSGGSVPAGSVAALVRPFARYTCAGAAPALCAGARRLLTSLAKHAPAHRTHVARTDAWKRMGCPPGGPEALESDDEGDDGEQDADARSDDEDDDSEKPLDPRAGRVDVELPLLPVPASLLADMLRDMLGQASSKAHRRVKICMERFSRLAAGEPPLPLAVPELPDSAPLKPKRAAHALRHFEHKLKADADELKLRGLSRKHRRRLLRSSRAGLSIVEDVAAYNKALSNHSNNGEWLVESTETKTKKQKQDTSNKENQDKGKKNGKINAQKRKSDTELQDGDVSPKKAKIEKNNKNHLVNNQNKKDNVAHNKSQSKKEKTNKVKNEKNQDVPEVQTTVTTKGKDEKGKDSKTKEAKADVAKHVKEVRTKKPKNQPQVIPERSEKINKTEVTDKSDKLTEETNKKSEKPSLLVNKVKNFEKQLPAKQKKDKTDSTTETSSYDTPKKVKFVLKNNSMQKPVDYYKSVRQSPSIPFDSSKKPSKTNLKPSTPSPINPFFKKKLRMKH